MSSWTPERVDKLKALFARGLYASEIARELGGVTRNTVCGKISRLGLQGRAKPSAPPVCQPSEPRRQHRATGNPRGPVPMSTIYLVPPSAAGPLTRAPRANALDALPGSSPRPFDERRTGDCKWPIGDGAMSCCDPVSRGGYCAPHAAIAFASPAPGRPATAHEYTRSLRRYADR